MKLSIISRGILLAGLAISSVSVAAPAAHADEPFIGELRTFGFNFCPRGWAKADGSLLPIMENTALFSLFGTIYGGDGRTTFALPDLRGRMVMGFGQAPGLSDYQIGEKRGAESSVPVGVTADPESTVQVRRAGDNHPPYLAMNVCIAMQGIYPSRN